jgi:hypothetical protein
MRLRARAANCFRLRIQLLDLIVSGIARNVPAFTQLRRRSRLRTRISAMAAEKGDRLESTPKADVTSVKRQYPPRGTSMRR